MLVPSLCLATVGYYFREDNSVPQAPPLLVETSGLWDSVGHPFGAYPSGMYNISVNVDLRYGKKSYFKRTERKPNWKIEESRLVDSKGNAFSQVARSYGGSYMGNQMYDFLFTAPISQIPKSKGQVFLNVKIIADGRWIVPVTVRLRNEDGSDIFTKSVKDFINEEERKALH